jgi:hypothetical protein
MSETPREMAVEVNETNIAIYELEKLTGNTKEVLLARAAEAEENGITLFCKIPNPDDPIHVNAFQHFGATDAPKVRGDEIKDGDVIINPEGATIISGKVIDVKDERDD